MKKYGIVVGFLATFVSYASLLFVSIFYSVKTHMGFQININRIINHFILFGILLFITNQLSGVYLISNITVFMIFGIIYLFYNKSYGLNIYTN